MKLKQSVIKKVRDWARFEQETGGDAFEGQALDMVLDWYESQQGWDVLDILQDDITASIDGQAAWARSKGVSAAYVNDVLKGRRDPGPKILDALGFERVVTYRPKQVEK